MKKAIVIAMTLATTLMAVPAQARKADVYTGRFDNLAVGGFDPVAYFTKHMPVKGSAEYKVEYEGALWYFSNAENRVAFLAAPEKFSPKYGGYCSWAAAQGYTARGNPKNWSIVDGALYLNYSDKVQGWWEEDIPGFISQADKNWPDAVLE